MEKDKKALGLYNLKIHYIWTFFSSILFLSPVITLYYKFHGMNNSDIVLITGIYFVFSFMLDIPTSTLGDNYPRTKVLLASVISSFISIIIYLLFPFKLLFFVAIFFAALGDALWSGTGHAKLQEDLEAADKKKDFGKMIGRLIAIQRFGTLFTPVAIFLILKYFPQSGYTILAGLDFVIWILVIFRVSKFKELEDIKPKIKFGNDLKEHIQTFKNGFSFITQNKIVLYFLLVSIFIHNNMFFQSMTLPILSDFGIKDYFASIFVWVYTGILIISSILSYKIADKLGNWKFFGIVAIGYLIIHLLYFFFIGNFWAFVILTGFLNLLIGFYFALWNHIFMDMTQIKEKATVRSFILSTIALYKGLSFWIFSHLSFSTNAAILTIQFLIGLIIFWKIIQIRKTTNQAA